TNVDVLTIGGGGGGSGAMWMAAGGGGAGGDVKICSQAVVDGDAIAAHVGAQGMGGNDVSYGHASSGGKSTAVFANGTTTTDLCVAEGGMPGDVPTMGDPESGWGFMGPTSGQGGYTIGGTNTGGFGSLYFVTDPDSYETGAGGGGAGYAGDGTSPICTSSACTSSAGADGVVINALSNAGTTLFSTDTREAGAGGGGGNFGAAALAVGGAHGGGAGGYGDSIDNTSNGSVAATLGSGGGGGYTGSPGEKYSSGGDGGAGAVILRYIAPPPPTTIATTTVTQVSATSISLGSTITDTATVTAAPVVTSAPAPQVAPMVAPTNPTGTVSFYYCYSATPITSCSSTANAAGASNVVTLVASGTDAATASVTWTPSQMGYYVMYAEYSGDADFDPSVDLNLAHGEEFQVTRVATHITLSCGTTCTEDSHDDHATYCSMTVGGKVTYTAKITADSGVIPTGSITFWEGGVLLGTATINSKGVATISISNLPLGLHIITAVYVGNVSLDGSVSNEMQLTVKLPASKTSLSATGLRSGNTAKKGATLKFTATVTGTKVSGSVKFYDGSTLLKTVSLSSGKATLSIATLALGEHKIKAVYAGTATLSGSESSEIVLTIQTK
ncbi:MAG: hypothetical protein RL441_1629, partial [Actinomycetota bacterium]